MDWVEVSSYDMSTVCEQIDYIYLESMWLDYHDTRVRCITDTWILRVFGSATDHLKITAQTGLQGIHPR
eukprot:scaffold185285_cov16-Prasinocladus_malaysianus.AAC.1